MRRGEARARFGDLHDKVLEILYRHDPIGLGAHGVPKDEYSPEASWILPRLQRCGTTEDVVDLVHGSFVHMFDVGTAGPALRYEEAAREIWELWRARGGDLDIEGA